ncbi:MAG: (d)CMP kinase [Pseudomonadota bacterium]|nr:(d)CMP kinase [Pseudomonadota bacterium]
MIIVAIDGLVGTGKSTIAQAVSKKLAWLYVSTGIFYRAVATLAAMHRVDVESNAALKAMLADTLPKVAWHFEQAAAVYYEQTDISTQLQQHSNQASIVSAHPAVRAALLPIQRQVVWSSGAPGAIVEGRDIGTIVFPQADLKIFITADQTLRAKRRSEQRQRDFQAVLAQIKERDTRDRTRPIAPTIKAADAITVDNSKLTTAQTVEHVLALIRNRQD